MNKVFKVIWNRSKGCYCTRWEHCCHRQ
ncbi:MAG: hypothetical protein IPJ92_06715 [Veillonella sp.]|nr:hypothetical protein [Veillonella sp.]MBP6923557.1 ESPR domain-containing protein [Veillonella sp.]